jgi:hypothetical protein
MISRSFGQRKSGRYGPRGFVDVGLDEACAFQEIEDGVLEF